MGNRIRFLIHQHDKDTLEIINTYNGFREACEAVNSSGYPLCEACKCYPRKTAKGYKWSKELIKRWK